MSFRSRVGELVALASCFARHPGISLRLLRDLPQKVRGFDHAERWRVPPASGPAPGGTPETPNPLRTFFDSRKTGRGIWKWLHYFDIYHRHFAKFVGREVHVLEIGVYSGGSLEMWRQYFGPKCRVYGVDIEPACRAYENDYTQIFIGDQQDRDFWKSFREKVPVLDILIDDGGHLPEQQIVTLEEMLPHLRPGGVFLCEDVQVKYNGFAAYMSGLAAQLNAISDTKPGITPTGFQEWIRSIHFYPYVTVIEKADAPVRELIAPKHGTEWQPFL